LASPYCCGKAISVASSECVSVALVIQLTVVVVVVVVIIIIIIIIPSSSIASSPSSSSYFSSVTEMGQP